MERGVHVSRRSSATLGGSGYGAADKDGCTTHFFVPAVPSEKIRYKMGNCHLIVSRRLPPRPDEIASTVAVAEPFGLL